MAKRQPVTHNGPGPSLYVATQLRLAVNFGLESRQVISNENSNDHVVSDAYVNFIPFGSSLSRSQLVAQFGISAMIRFIVWAHRPHCALIPKWP
jgi:hypothetical protein